MSQDTVSLSLKDFDELPWEVPVSQCNGKDCSEYAGAFQSRALTEPDASRRKEVWLFLATISRIPLTSDVVEGIHLGHVVGQLQDEQCTLAGELAGRATDPELKARMSDIAWSRRNKGRYELAKICIAAYVESARNLEHPEQWRPCWLRVERALKLAKQIRSNELVDLVLKYAEEVVIRCNGEDPYLLSATLMEMLQRERRGDAALLALLAEKKAFSGEDSFNFEMAREYWRIAARWQVISEDPTGAENSVKAACETYVKEAAHRIAAQHLGRYGVAAEMIKRAIEAYRRIGLGNQEGSRLRALLNEYEKFSVTELIPLDTERPDLADIISRAEASVEGLSIQKALFALAGIVKPTDSVAAKERTRENHLRGDFYFHAILAQTITNGLGRTIARTPDLTSSDPVTVEKGILAQTYLDCHRSWSMTVEACIDPVRRKILANHHVTKRDFYFLVTDNPFVPPGREGIFATALFAGMIGEFALCAHLVIPQIENSVRQLLYAENLPTSGLDSDGIEMERNLSQTLVHADFVPTLEEKIGKDMLFDLRGLLIDKHGTNLRNEMAHGTMDMSEFYSWSVCYVWWLTLRLCFHFALGLHLDSQEFLEPSSTG